jgi:hypothetical protein
MLRPSLLTRASIGLAASAVEHVVALPGRAVGAVASLPAVPVRVAGGLVQSYLHAGQTLTEFAVKGDRVLAAVFPSRSDQPEWATFDEDVADATAAYGTAAGAGDEGDGPDVPTGRVTPRAT